MLLVAKVINLEYKILDKANIIAKTENQKCSINRNFNNSNNNNNNKIQF